MEKHKQGPIIHAIMTFEEKFDMETLRHNLRTNLLQYRAFRSTLQPSSKGYQWVETPQSEFKLENHVFEFTMAPGNHHEGLNNHVSLVLNEPLPEDRPPWAVHVLHYPGYPRVDIVYRFSHAIADGITLASMCSSMATPEGEDVNAALPTVVSQPQTRSCCSKFLAGLLSFFMIFWVAVKLVKRSCGRGDTRSILKAKPKNLGDKKLFGHSRKPMSLPGVKAAAKKLNCTVNDVIVAALAGGVRRYLEANRDETLNAGQLVTYGIGVMNLRALLNSNDVDKLLDDFKYGRGGNDFTYFQVPLRTGKYDDPAQRVLDTQKDMHAIKSSPEAVLTALFNKAVGWLCGSRLLVKIWNVFMDKCTVGISNLTGPRAKLKYGDCRVSRIFNCVGPMRLGSFLSVCSYADQINLGVSSDPSVVSNPQVLVDYVHDEVDQLLKKQL